MKKETIDDFMQMSSESEVEEFHIDEEMYDHDTHFFDQKKFFFLFD